MVGVLRALPGQLTLFGFAIVLFLAAGSLFLPLGPDQAIFTWVGTVILDGGIPYRDAWEIKGPITHYVYALATALFGREEVAIRILDIAFVVSCCWLLRRLVLRLNEGDTFGANCAVILFCLLYYAGGYADIAQPEGWGGMVIAGVGALLLGPSRRSQRVMVAVGALIAIAVLIKPTFIVYLLLPCLFGTVPRTTATARLPALVSCLLSFVAVIGAAVLLLMYVGALNDLLDMLRYLYTTYPQTKYPLLSAFTVLPRTLYEFGLLVPYLLVPLGLWRIRRCATNRSAMLVAAWFGLANLTVLVQGRYWQDHWLPAAAATAVIVGVASTHVGRHLRLRDQQRVGAGVLALLLLLLAFAPIAARALSRNHQWPAYAIGLTTRDEYVAHVLKPFNEVRHPFNYLELRTLADFIARHSRPDDRLVVWGWDVSVFIMSGRRSATRFGVFQPLVDEGAVRDEYRSTFLREIAAQAPAYIIIDTRGAWAYEGTAGLDLLHEFPEFERLVHSRYELRNALGAYQIWTRIR